MVNDHFFWIFRETRSAQQAEIARFGPTSIGSPKHSVLSAGGCTTPTHAAPRVPFLQRRITNPLSDGDLFGKSVGLIGCGHIGRRLIKFLKPFETPVYVYDPYLPREMADALGFTLTSLENVLSKTDVIVCLAPITPRTQGLIGAHEINLIPPGKVFVNVSRGQIVDSDALITRLKRGDLVAGLDVFDPEPVPSDSEVLGLPNVFLSPHIAGVTAPSYPRMFSLMVDELDRFFQGHEPYFELTPRSIANRRGTNV